MTRTRGRGGVICVGLRLGGKGQRGRCVGDVLSRGRGRVEQRRLVEELGQGDQGQRSRCGGAVGVWGVRHHPPWPSGECLGFRV